MIIGVVKAQLHMQGIRSLKGKRSIVKSLIGRLKSRFNISIAEVDHQDNRTSAVIAIAMVSNDARFIDQQMLVSSINNLMPSSVLCKKTADSTWEKLNGRLFNLWLSSRC
jgi:uncharacterized protein YlxP (DUF503 family)